MAVLFHTLKGGRYVQQDNPYRQSYQRPLKYTPQGTPVTSFRIAVNSRLSQEKQETLFIDIIAFGRADETSNEYLTKGSSAVHLECFQLF